jgi:hypothetical protein
MEHGNHGLQLECQSFTIVSLLIKAQGQVPNFSEQSIWYHQEIENQGVEPHARAKNGRFFGVAMIFKY